MSALGIIPIFIALAVVAIVIAGLWKIFEKAGHPGWASIVPFYNYYIITKIAGKPGWWLILLLIPYVNFIFSFIIYIAIAKKFGKGAGFGVGMVLLGPIFIPMLGFSDAQYEGAEDNSNEDLLDA